MKTATKTTTKPVAANDTSTTPHLDALAAHTLATQLPPARWALEGWASHLRATRHAIHAANALAKHCDDFDFACAGGHALTFTIARLADFGLGTEEAHTLIGERVAARRAKAAA